jgi:hypothetical protein
MHKISGVTDVLQRCSTSTKHNPTAYGAANDGFWCESRALLHRSSSKVMFGTLRSNVIISNKASTPRLFKPVPALCWKTLRIDKSLVNDHVEEYLWPRILTS